MILIAGIIGLVTLGLFFATLFLGAPGGAHF